jgi:hypothetical protein
MSKPSFRYREEFRTRLAYESPRGRNPRCVVGGLWGFEELRVLSVTGVAFTRLPRPAVRAVLSADQGAALNDAVGQVGADVWDRHD